MTSLSTRHEVVAALDGRKAVAGLLGKDDPHCVSNWMRRGFPRYTFSIMQAALKVRGYTAPASLWRMPEQPPVEIRRRSRLEAAPEGRAA